MWRPALGRTLAVMVVVGLVILPGLVQRLHTVDAGAVWAAISAVPASGWTLALLATLVSYLAVGGHDRTMHRHLATGIGSRRAGFAGASALAIGQTVGLGVLSAALVRWRMLPELGPLGALRLSGTVSLLALGAGLVSGAPAGIGAFELVLLASFPDLDPAHLLGATLAWRLVYFALPAILGALAAQRSTGPAAVTPERPMPIRQGCEAGLIGQGALVWHPQGFVAGRTSHALVAFGEAVDPGVALQAARVEGRFPVLYKVPGRSALLARQQGLKVLAVAVEAWLSTEAFSLEGPNRAGVRRKLRRAEAAGVVATLDPMPDARAFSAINAAWVAVRRPERGFSIGRFQPDRLGQDPTVVARVRGRVVGFATVLPGWAQGQLVWTLDLLRPHPKAPDGTAQVLILAALDAARAAGVARLSLAAAPGWLMLALGGAEVARAILRPRPERSSDMRRMPSCDAEYEIAPASVAWQGKGDLAN